MLGADTAAMLDADTVYSLDLVVFSIVCQFFLMPRAFQYKDIVQLC